MTLPSTILVVEDNRDIMEMLTLLLTRHGMHVLQAYTGPECLEIVRTHTVDVLLLDALLSGMDGLAVCAALRQLAPTLPIILATARDDRTTRAAAMDLGVSECITKPFNQADLLAQIRTQLSLRR